MKKLSFFLGIGLLSIGMACTPTNSKTQILSQEAFKDSIQKSEVQLADLRTPEEHAEEGKFENAINIDFTEDDFYQQMEEHFDKDKPLYIHCKRGLKSHESVKKLQKLGFTQVYELAGGFDNWDGTEDNDQ